MATLSEQLQQFVRRLRADGKIRDDKRVDFLIAAIRKGEIASFEELKLVLSVRVVPLSQQTTRVNGSANSDASAESSSRQKQQTYVLIDARTKRVIRESPLTKSPTELPRAPVGQEW